MGGISSGANASELQGLTGSASVGSFGDKITSNLNPVVTLKAVYGLLDDVETFTATGGSATASSSEFVCQSGTSAGGYGTILSEKSVVYQSGIGCEARITARFTTGIASSTQLAGFFTASDGMMFGYNGTDFGVMHRYGGELEIRTITITAVSGGSETVTVTLNGTGYALSVGSSATVQEAAHDVEQQLIASAANTSWEFQHINDTIVCRFRGVGAKSGAYSVASTGTLTGTVAQTNAGAAATEDWTYQSSWNKNTATWIDPTKGNLYRLEFAYLGYGFLNYYVIHPESAQWVLVHQIKYPNANNTTNFGNPSLRVGWASASLGSTGTNLTVAGGSAMGALQGKNNDGFRSFAAVGNNSAITTETQILSVKVRTEFGGRICQAVVIPAISVATDSQKGMIFNVYKNATVAGDTNHQYIDQSNSVCIYDTAGTTVSGGKLVYSVVVGPNGSRSLSTDDLGSFLVAGDELTITGQVSSGAQSGGFVTIDTREIL